MYGALILGLFLFTTISGFMLINTLIKHFFNEGHFNKTNTIIISLSGSVLVASLLFKVFASSPASFLGIAIGDIIVLGVLVFLRKRN